MLNAMSPVPKPNFEFSPYNLHKTKWPENGFNMGRLDSKRPLIESTTKMTTRSVLVCVVICCLMFDRCDSSKEMWSMWRCHYRIGNGLSNTRWTSAVSVSCESDAVHSVTGYAQSFYFYVIIRLHRMHRVQRYGLGSCHRCIIVCISVCLSVCVSVGHSHQPCKNGWTSWADVWVMDSGGHRHMQ